MGIKLNIMRPDQTGIRRFLGDLEADVMETVWLAGEPVSVGFVLEDMAKRRELAYTTVMTVMSRLADKGLLSKDKDGKQFLYTAAVSRCELSGSFIKCALSDLGSELSAPALAQFVDGISKEDDALLGELEELIRRKRKDLEA